MRKKEGSVPVMVSVILLFVTTAAAGYLFMQSRLDGQNSQSLVNSTPKPSLITSEVTSTPAAILNPNSKVYVSSGMGVSFNYAAKSESGGGTVLVKEEGNKIYVYISTMPKYTDGQWIEVFSKDKTDSLSGAIKKKFLTGYSSTNCFVTSPTDYGKSYPNSYQTATIDVPKSPDEDMSTLSLKWQKCPEPYVAENGMSYFLEDTDHPDKFVYFSIGQYGIESGILNLMWQDTIKFL